MTRNIYLKGRMGKLFGEKHRLNCKTVQEAMHAIDVMKGGMRQYLMDCTENGVHFTVQKGEEFLDQQEVGLELGKDDIIISPVPKGAANDIVKIIVGITLMIIGFTVDPSGNAAKVGLQMLATIGANLALSGIIGLMTDDPEELNEEESTLFNGPINNTKSGIPVPLAYGRMEVGGAVVNFGFTDYRIRGNQGYQFVSKGTSSGTGTGGGGGGSAGGRSNNEDSNWVQEE